MPNIVSRYLRGFRTGRQARICNYRDKDSNKGASASAYGTQESSRVSDYVIVSCANAVGWNDHACRNEGDTNRS